MPGLDRYRVVKVFDDLSCCHRAWAHDGRCRFLHGYARSFEIEFVASALEEGTGFVVDFSKLKGVRALLQQQFDHTTIVAASDPELPRFRELHEAGILDLRVMDHPGMEGAASWVLEHADRLIRGETDGRVRVCRVTARESSKNAVTVSRDDAA